MECLEADTICFIIEVGESPPLGAVTMIGSYSGNANDLKGENCSGYIQTLSDYSNKNFPTSTGTFVSIVCNTNGGRTLQMFVAGDTGGAISHLYIRHYWGATWGAWKEF